MSELYFFSPDWRYTDLGDGKAQLFSMKHQQAFELSSHAFPYLITHFTYPFSIDDFISKTQSLVANSEEFMDFLFKAQIIQRLELNHFFFNSTNQIMAHPSMPLSPLLPGDEWLNLAVTDHRDEAREVLQYRPKSDKIHLNWKGSSLSFESKHDFYTYPEVIVEGALLINRLKLVRLAEARYRWASEMVKNKNQSVVNFGCGFGAFEKFCRSRQMDLSQWLSVDRDADSLQRALFPSGHRQLEWDFDKPWEQGEFDLLILMEVLEHWPLETLSTRLLALCDLINPKHVLVTLPNADANKYYSTKKSFRHHDHKWEKGADDCDKLLAEIFLNKALDKIQRFGIGAEKEGQHMTYGWKISLKAS